MPKVKRDPSYRFHKARKCAVVTIGGKNFYLGKFNSPESWERYYRLLAQSKATPAASLDVSDREALAVKELMAAFWIHAKKHYVKNGEPTSEIGYYRYALRELKELYASTAVSAFGPLALKAVRQAMLDRGTLSRKGINARVERIRRMFRWGVSEQLVDVTVYQALLTVRGLQKGRTEARENAPIGPVADHVVDATLPHLQNVVADMVRFQRLTGARPAEVCILRPMDVDRTGEVWWYRPESHKCEHHETDRGRIIFIGPKAQEVLLPYLLRDAAAYCFSPAESEAARKAAMRANRKTRVQPSQADRSKPGAKRKPGERYTRVSYRKAVHRACDLADKQTQGPRLPGTRIVPRWSPNRLRHSAATAIADRYDIDAARCVLGHSNPRTTSIYAEPDLAKAADVMKAVG